MLRLSEDAACNRISAARACRRFPAIFDLLSSGTVSLTAVRMLSPHLTSENHAAVVARAGGRTLREIEALVAELAPRPDVASSVRKVPIVAPAESLRVPAPTVATDTTTPPTDPAASLLTEPAASLSGQCGFISKSGRRCTERTFLEFHHIVPYARGGQATVENISLRCRRHNQYESELAFGGRGVSEEREYGPWQRAHHGVSTQVPARSG